jgi:SAM-dependent methyltransferase
VKTEEIKELIQRGLRDDLPPWEQEYLDYHAARFAETMDLLGPGEGKRLLDVGAFPGHLTLAVQSLGFQVEALTGLNESLRGLQRFTSRLEKQGIPVSLADVESDLFPFPDKSFDVVLAAEIIEHLPYNPYHLLREAFRVLKPEGRLLLSTPNLPKLDNLIRFLGGRTIHPDIRLPFHKTFKSILIGRHIREYTSSELIYMLEEQNKEMYRFENSKVSYSMCLDPAFSWSGAVSWVIKRFWPRFQSTLFVESFRPKAIELVQPEEVDCQGFFEIEKQAADLGSTGRILATPFRWSRDRFTIDLPAGPAAYQVFVLHLVFMAPRFLNPVVFDIRIGHFQLGRVGLPPGREYVPVHLALPAHLSQDGRFKVSWEGTTWKPADHAHGVDYYEFPVSDTRDLGVAVAWDGFLTESCQDRKELQIVAQREYRRWRLHEGNEGRWSPLSGLYFVHTKLKPNLSIGPGDWRQLGLGWHHLERWKQGWVRWSSKESEVYLEPAGQTSRLKLQIYTGDKALGQEVSGVLFVEWAADRLAFLPLTEKSFSLPSDIWTELTVDWSSSLSCGGVLRIRLTTDQPRVPARLIPGSQDERELGLAVAGLGVT